MASGINLRTFTFIDVLQPQTAAFIGTISKGYMPLEGQAALFVEVSPGMGINGVMDAVLKNTSCTPGIMVVERRSGVLEVHDFDQGQVRAAADSISETLGIKESDRLKPRIVSSEIISGLSGHQSQLVNRMRHGDFIHEHDTMYVLEVHPAGYALLATNEAEKAANIHVLEMLTFGAFGRVYLGGKEEDINQAAAAILAVLEAVDGRDNPGK